MIDTHLEKFIINILPIITAQEGILDKLQNIYDMQCENRNISVRLDTIQKFIVDHSKGTERVYHKFLELDKKQKDIENLLQGDKVKELLAAIPTKETINNLLERINDSNIGALNKHLSNIKSDLDDLSEVLRGY